MTSAERLNRAQELMEKSEYALSRQAYDRAAMYAQMASAHVAIAKAGAS